MFTQLHVLLYELSKLHQTLSKTKQLHALVSKTHLSNDPFYATRITRFYALNNDLISARKLFDGCPQRSVYLWNSIIRAYARAHKFCDAFWLFEQMLSSETRPDNFTFACILRACSENFDLDGLRLVHGGAICSGLGRESVCCSALVSAYSKVGLIDYACKVFYAIHDPDTVLWNSMILGYGCCGNWEEGLKLFSIMRNIGKRPDGYTLVGLISGLVDPCLLEIGKGIHGFCLKIGFDSNAHLSSAFVNMYLKLKCMDSACRVFNNLSQPDLVTWSSLITGLSLYGEYEKALILFKNMNMEGGKADPILIAGALGTTAQSAIVGPGREIHGYAVRHDYVSQVMVSAALIDMYSKCGFLELGVRVFKTTSIRNIISFNSVISSLGLYGFPFKAFEMFRELVDEGLKPDEYTFSALLSSCCHAGLVNDGRKFFRRMKHEFGIIATTEHYVYMVKLLGMAGQLEEAYDIIRSLPAPVDSSIWGALLSCCNAHGNSGLAEIVAQRLFEIEPQKNTFKVMLSNIYAGDGRWDDAKKLRDDMLPGAKRKMPGVSWMPSVMVDKLQESCVLEALSGLNSFMKKILFPSCLSPFLKVRTLLANHQETIA